MKLVEGDVISFKLTSSSCWGPKGEYKAVIVNENNKLIVHHLDLKMIAHKLENSSCQFGYDYLEDFLECCYLDDVKVLKNISIDKVV